MEGMVDKKMNKYQKALNNLFQYYVLKDNNDFCENYNNQEEDIATLQELCDKESPLKPNYEKDEIGDRGTFGGTGYMTFTNATCPNCNEYLDEEHKPYRCTECGQIIDWYDDDDFYDEDEGDYD